MPSADPVMMGQKIYIAPSSAGFVLQKRPDRVRSFFQALDTRYAA